MPHTNRKFAPAAQRKRKRRKRKRRTRTRDARAGIQEDPRLGPEVAAGSPGERLAGANWSSPATSPRQVIRAPHSGRWLAGALLLLASAEWAAHSAGQAARPPAEFQVVGQARGVARLPCLIGKRVFCGEPYFIAWYRFNTSARAWLRIEWSPDEGAARESAAPGPRPLDERARFLRLDQQAAAGPGASQCLGGDQATPANAAASRPPLADQFDCAQLSIGALELADEGQYKCEITFSDTLDFERCPASTVSQLLVVARPNEPEILVNGRAAVGQQRPQGAAGQQLKEGVQVRLECQSAGGKPAPRIDWLNLSLPVGGRPELHPLPAAQQQQQPIKRLGGGPAAPGAPGAQPVTSSSVTVQLSRHELHSRFVCLVLPQRLARPDPPAPPDEWRDPASLAKLLDRIPMLANARGARLGDAEPMLKWIAFDVQVKPSRVSLSVRDLAADSPVQPAGAEGAGPRATQGSAPAPAGAEQQPRDALYTVQPNRLYAIQCLVENARPRAQVTWFNRTALVELEATQLVASDYLLPAAEHRLSSFVRYLAHESGLTSTLASLLVTPNYWDKFEEFSCRVSSDAFQFDELAQVAPILSAKLHVNYPPSGWLEAPGVALNWSAGGVARLARRPGGQLQLRCNVAANPLNQNAILQIDWLREGRPLAGAPGGRLRLEQTNHLHMPAGAAGDEPDGRPAAASRLFASSQLVLGRLVAADAGLYSCQFKLIPTPSEQQAAGRAPPATRILAGQPNQAVRLELGGADAGAEDRPGAPVLRLSASRAFLVYDKIWAPGSAPATPSPAGPAASQLSTVVFERPEAADWRSLALSFKCDLAGEEPRAPAFGRRVIWYLDGLFLYASGQSDTFNVSLAAENGRQLLQLLLEGGPLSCAHHLLAGGAQTSGPAASPLPEAAGGFHGANSVRVHPSANRIRLVFEVEPRLLDRRDLMPAVRRVPPAPPPPPPSSTNLTSGDRIESTCLAQCEPPVCSIEWLLNGDRLRAVADSPVEATRADNETLTVRVASSRQLESVAYRRKWTQIETLIQPRHNSTRFAWFKRASLLLASSGEPRAAAPSAPLDSQPQANVISKLELDRSLFAGRAAGEQLALECRLDPNPGAHQGPGAASQDELNAFAFNFVRVKPFEWAPGAGGAPLDLGEGLFVGQLDDSPTGSLRSLKTTLELENATSVDETDSDAAANRADGRPVCKLSLGNQFLNEQSELLVSLLCSVRSRSPLLETIWLRNNQQVAANQTTPALPDERHLQRLQVVVLNRQQQFMLTDLMTQSGNFRCIARNSLGYSEACELDPLDKSILLNSFKPMSQPGLQVLSQTLADQLGGSATAPGNLSMAELLDSSRAGQLPRQQDHQASFASMWRRWIGARIHWLLLSACLVAGVWLATLLGSAYIKRHCHCSTGASGAGGAVNCASNIAALYGLPDSAKKRPKKKKRKKGKKWKGGSVWRFASEHHANLSRASSATNVELPFGQLTSKHSSNYYGGLGANSNGDSSEHDMIQSCSQSSHYDDFIQHQLQQQARQQLAAHQPVYFNGQQQLVQGSATLNKCSRAPMMKLCSLSSGSTGAETMRNVPLIDGDRSRSSRIRLDGQQQHHQSTYSGPGNQLTFAGRPANARPQAQEHIYDDVIYNQMIL